MLGYFNHGVRDYDLTLPNINSIYHARGQHEFALGCFQKHVCILPRLFSTVHPYMRTPLGKIAAVHSSKQSFRLAIQCCYQASNISRTVLLHKNTKQSRSMLEYGSFNLYLR
jgi:hypothetical protein